MSVSMAADRLEQELRICLLYVNRRQTDRQTEGRENYPGIAWAFETQRPSNSIDIVLQQGHTSILLRWFHQLGTW